MYLVKTPSYLRQAFPQLEWSYQTKQKSLFLTFDDGPDPATTPVILDILQRYKAKGTFFCVGDNIQKYPTVFNDLLDNGHQVGSHTFNHLNGWRTPNVEYYRNVRRAAALTQTPLFRPPYGRITPNQSKFLAKYYRIVMWDVLSGDFDTEVSADVCYSNVVKNAKNGSIIVFHDSLKSIKTVQEALPKILDHFALRGYAFEAIK
jgi:peptidoglycan-N-acetylglucosamine deacetylase